MTDEQEITAYRAGLQSALREINLRLIEIDQNAAKYNLDSSTLATALFGMGLAMNAVEDMLKT